MYTCPHCGQAGISFWQKVYMGSTRTAACKKCGSRASVTYSRTFRMAVPIANASLLLWIGGAFLVLVPSEQRMQYMALIGVGSVAHFVAFVLLAVALHVRLNPLARREMPLARRQAAEYR